MTETISAGRILSQTAVLIRRGALRATGALAAISAISILIDLGFVGESNVSGLNLLDSGITTAAAYWVTKSMLQEFAGRPLPARFPAFLGLGLLSWVAILLGLVLLIVPGIILLVRWSLSDPILLAGDDSVAEAMRRSWRMTGPYFWPILFAFTALCVPALILMGLSFALDSYVAESSVAAVVTGLALNAAVVAGWHAAVAIYVLLETSDPLAETFA